MQGFIGLYYTSCKRERKAAAGASLFLIWDEGSGGSDHSGGLVVLPPLGGGVCKSRVHCPASPNTQVLLLALQKWPLGFLSFCILWS